VKELDKKYILKIMRLVMIEEDPGKYIEDIDKILNLFNELDSFEENVKDLPPLYHPLEQPGMLRPDIINQCKIEINEVTTNISDGYVSSPPIRGVKKFKEP
jgi:aspartyl/glutamyl-tRNA(Asn/Gln) amidotransferase C subunit